MISGGGFGDHGTSIGYLSNQMPLQEAETREYSGLFGLRLFDDPGRNLRS